MSREMKNSGVPWLKDIPSNWNVERGKNVLVLQKRPVRESDDVVTCFRDGEVILRSLRRTEGFTMSDKEIGYQGINEGDIVIHGMDGFAGAMGVSKSTGKGSPVLVVCSPKYDAIPQYIIYYLRALAMTDVFIALATGIRERSCDLRWNKISELEFILPSSIEQQKIASFLDRKCSEIDEMIALQEKIIEELKAYKQSVITEAVTKGLNPDVQMKDSGIEWIGEIPEHWKQGRLKNYFHLHGRIGWNGLRSEEFQENSYAYLVTGQDFVSRDVNWSRCYQIRKERYDEDEYIQLKNGDILVTKDGTIGKVAVVSNLDKPACLNSGIFVVKQYEPKQYYPEFIYWLFVSPMLKTFNDFLNLGGTTIIHLYQNVFERMPMLLPPFNEQKAIAEYLNAKCAEIDNLISIKLSKIDSLKEYKKSIIYEYVTGKKEVI